MVFRYIISFCTKIDIKEIYNNLKYQNNYLTSKNLASKTGEADILVEVNNMVLNIEMNRRLSKKLFIKNKEYVSMLDSINTKKVKNGKIKNKYIVQINISTKRRIPKTNVLLYEIVQMDRNLKVEDVYNNYIIYDINLEYLKEELYNKGKLTKEEKGLLMFIETNMHKLKEIFKGDEEMKKTVEDLSAVEFFKKDIEFYESYDHEEFEKEVEKEAREEEIAEAKEEGIHQRNIEIAKKMLSKNMNINEISEITNLSIEEINKIKNK